MDTPPLVGKGLLSDPQPPPASTRVHELRYPHDILPPEYYAQVWDSPTSNGYYRTISQHSTHAEAAAALPLTSPN